MDGKGFPVLNPSDPDLYESYQAHQPPIYYLMAAGWCKALGIDPTSESGGFGLRLLNTLVGLSTLVGLCLCAKWAFGQWEHAWAAGCFVLVPMNVALHSAASNDPLLIACALGSWPCSRLRFGAVGP